MQDWQLSNRCDRVLIVMWRIKSMGICFWHSPNRFSDLRKFWIKFLWLKLLRNFCHKFKHPLTFYKIKIKIFWTEKFKWNLIGNETRIHFKNINIKLIQKNLPYSILVRNFRGSWVLIIANLPTFTKAETPDRRVVKTI